MRNLGIAESQHRYPCKPIAGCRGDSGCASPHACLISTSKAAGSPSVALLTSSVGVQSVLLLLLLLPLLLVIEVVLLLILLLLLLFPDFPRILDLCLVQAKNSSVVSFRGRKHFAFSLEGVCVALSYNLFISLAKPTY